MSDSLVDQYDRLRAEMVASGIPTLNEDEPAREIAERRYPAAQVYDVYELTRSGEIPEEIAHRCPRCNGTGRI